MERGEELGKDFIKLCRLLITVGESFKAKELLIANSEPGDTSDDLLRSEFPAVETRLGDCISTFEHQFECRLLLQNQKLSLQPRFSIDYIGNPGDDIITRILSSSEGCEVLMCYEPTDVVVADLYELKAHGLAVPLAYKSEQWEPE